MKSLSKTAHSMSATSAAAAAASSRSFSSSSLSPPPQPPRRQQHRRYGFGYGFGLVLLVVVAAASTTRATTAASAFVTTTATNSKFWSVHRLSQAPPLRPMVLALAHRNVEDDRTTAASFPRPSSVTGGEDNKGNENVRGDIETMKRQAAERLKRLEVQLKDLEREQHGLRDATLREVKHERIIQRQQVVRSPTKLQPPQEDEDEAEDAVDEIVPFSTTAAASQTTEGTTSSTSSSSRVTNPAVLAVDPRRYDRLEETRWKLGFNLGREPGTWMPPDWGASGSRLYFEVVLDFTSEPCYEPTDEFFMGRAGCKILKVKDAWMFPTGTGSASVGRRNIHVQPHGVYKVLPGQGPQGTDIVRLCLDVLDDHAEHDDVKCPVGRVYGTCGYFVVNELLGHQVMSLESTSHKDELAAEHRALLAHYEQLKMEDEQDPNLLHKLGRMQELFQVRKQLEDAAQRLQRERQVHPDKSDLRFSRDRDVALSREGGVCRKVHKGLAIEYHILGRMEVASIRKEDCDDHDDESAGSGRNDGGARTKSSLRP